MGKTVGTASSRNYTDNVEALTAVQPKDLTAAEITVKLGTTWIPPEYIKEFTFELLETSYWAKREIDVHYSKLTGDWNISGKAVTVPMSKQTVYMAHIE